MKVFDDYVRQFDFNDESIKYKYFHSYRVQKFSERLSDELNLSKSDKELASVIGLLHDIGRFDQLEEFHSFDDKLLDHADYGVKLLFEDNMIEKFEIDNRNYEIIKKAIANHNKYNIEANLKPKELFHAKLIRDADKLDILNAFSSIRVLELQDSEEEITEEITKQFFNKEQVNVKSIKNNNDKIVSLFAFIFDVNFEVTIRIIEEEQFYENLYNNLQNKNKFKKYFDFVNKYIKERKNNNVG